MRVYAEEFKKIYNPSVGEDKPWYINDHTLIRNEKGWHLFGITHEEPANAVNEVLCAHAFSPDLLHVPFEKIKPSFRAEKEAAERHFWAPHVIAVDGLYYMYYCAGSLEGSDTYRIHLATSSDLMHWTRHEANPMVIDGFDARDPMLLRVDGRWVMYYTCNSTPTGGNHCVAAVFSDDLTHWSDKKVVFTSSRVGTYGGPCESPFVEKVGDTYFLFIGAFDATIYADTAVFASKDPFFFREEDLVGRIPSHAAEIIRLGEEYYITHCGWGQGGVYPAKRHFERKVLDKSF